MEGERVPPEQIRWAVPTVNYTATLHVLRSSKDFQQSTLQLDYFGYSSAGGAAFNGMPSLPYFKTGEIRMFALKPIGSGWRLIGEEGDGIAPPAIELSRKSETPESPRQFLLREIVHSLANGSQRDRHQSAVFLRDQHNPLWLDAIFNHLAEVLTADDTRWLDIGTAALATLGIPRLPIDKLPKSFAIRVLDRVPVQGRNERIIRNMLRDSASHDWGSAATLVEFKDHPVLLDSLPRYLERNQPGSLGVAMWLVPAGQTALLSQSLQAASRALSDPKTTYSDMHAAVYLLMDHGSDAQFGALLAELVRTQSSDTNRYMQIWNAAHSQRIARVKQTVAVLLRDERIFSSTMRYCDIAGGRLQQITGEKFGFIKWDQPLAERNEALARARVWLATH